MGDAIAVAEADIVFVNAMGFETWSETLIQNSGTSAETINVNVNSDALYVEGEIDPHVWNVPKRHRDDAGDRGQLERNSVNKSVAFEANMATTVADLRYIIPLMAGIAVLPADRRTVVTAHDAFGYLGRAAGLTFLAPLGIDGEGEPSAKELAGLIDQIQQLCRSLVCRKRQQPRITSKSRMKRV